MLVYGRFRPTADGWPWLTAESAASHVKQGIFPCFKFSVCSCRQGRLERRLGRRRHDRRSAGVPGGRGRGELPLASAALRDKLHQPCRPLVPSAGSGGQKPHHHADKGGHDAVPQLEALEYGLAVCGNKTKSLARMVETLDLPLDVAADAGREKSEDERRKGTQPRGGRR